MSLPERRMKDEAIKNSNTLQTVLLNGLAVNRKNGNKLKVSERG